MVGVAAIVFGVLFTVAVCFALGRLLFRVLGIHLRRGEHNLLAGVMGTPLLSLLVFVLCALRVATPPVFLTLGLLSIGTAVLVFRKERHKAEPLPPISAYWKSLFLIAFALYALVYLSNSLAPEHSPDGSSYHLGLVNRYFRDHGFIRLTTNVYGSLSQGVEMLFLFAFAFGRHSAAATVHCCFLFALPLLMLSYARRIGHPRAGVAAAMLVYLSPVAGIDGVSAYNDIALATVAFALFYLLEIWRERGDDRLMIPAGMLAGFCFAIKYTGFVAPLYMLAVVLFTRRGGAAILRAGIASAAAAAMALPWLLKNWLWMDNPLSPFYNRVFRNPYVHITFEDNWREVFRTYLLPSLKPLFRIVTVTGETGGQLGPLFLLAPLALLALRHRRGRHCLLAAAFFLATYPANIGTRFLLPPLPFIALGMAFTLEAFAPLLTVMVVLALVLAWPRVIDMYRSPSGGWQIEHMPWQVALQLDSPVAFLEQRWSGYSLARKIEELVPASKRLWSTAALPEAYLNRQVLVNYYSAEGEKIEDVLQTPVVQDFQPLWNLRFTFTPRTLSHLRLVQTGAGKGDVWSIGEARFFHGDQELFPVRAEAQPFPWDVKFAFDHNPVTRWHTWEPMRSGQHVDVEFAEPVELDRVELYCSHDQWSMRVRLEGSNLEKDARQEQVHLPPGWDLRRLATRTIKSLGIDYLLIGYEYPTARDMQEDASRWALREKAALSAGRLYEIQ